MAIGERIRKYRIENGMTQKELGKKCGLADSAIRRYELGGANPKIETIQKIAAALGISIYELTEKMPDDTIQFFSEYKSINSVLALLEKAGYIIIQTPCFLNHGDWNVRTIKTDDTNETIKAAFNDKLKVLTKGCYDYKLMKLLCDSCENNKYTNYIIKKGKKNISITIEEMQRHIDDIVKYTDFLFSGYK